MGKWVSLKETQAKLAVHDNRLCLLYAGGVRMDIRIIKKFCMAAKQAFLFMVLLLPALLVILPILLLLSGSLMDIWELGKYISPAFTEGKEFVSWKLLPDYPTFTGYGKLLFETPEFFVLFWNSMKLAVCILAGQLLVAVPVGGGVLPLLTSCSSQAPSRRSCSLQLCLICSSRHSTFDDSQCVC